MRQAFLPGAGDVNRFDLGGIGSPPGAVVWNVGWIAGAGLWQISRRFINVA